MHHGSFLGERLCSLFTLKPPTVWLLNHLFTKPPSFIRMIHPGDDMHLIKVVDYASPVSRLTSSL